MTESPTELAKEAGQGQTTRTPAIALTGVTIAVAALVAVILAAALIVYFVL